MSSFKKRIIRLTFTLGKGSFGSSGKNTLTIQGLRASINIQTALAFASAADVTVYGLKQSDMNALTTYNKLTTIGNISADELNTILVEVGDKDGMDVVFYGHIFNAFGDYNNAPNVALRISASAGLWQRIAPAPAISFKEDFEIAPQLEALAKRMGYVFENSGVTAKLPPTYLAGTAFDQADKLAHDANINLIYDGRVMAIFPKGGVRKKTVPILTKDSGLVGYPTFDQLGMSLQCLYTPRVVFGGAIQIEMDRILADATKANKNPGQNEKQQKIMTTWFVSQCSYYLESETPGGQWFLDLRATNISTDAIRV